MGTHGLGAHRGLCDLQKDLLVVDGDFLCPLRKDLVGLLRSLAVPGHDHRRVDLPLDERFRVREELPGQDDRRRCAIATLLVLGLRHLDHHLRGRVLHIDLLEDCDPVICDRHVPHGVHEQLVLAPRAERGAHRIGDRPRGGDVVLPGSATFFSRCSFSKNENLRSCTCRHRHLCRSSDCRV